MSDSKSKWRRIVVKLSGEALMGQASHGLDARTVEAIAADRMGVRESIIGRMERRGGSAEIVSRPNWGTEVRLKLPT